MLSFMRMNKLEREMEIIKHCHTPKNIQEIADELAVDERIIRRYINDYLPKFDFPVMQVDVNRLFVNDNSRFTLDAEANDEYKTTVHPVCLALNLTEVYLLTIGTLSRIPTDDIMYDVYVRLLSKIFTQLSAYGKDILNKAEPDHKLKELRHLRYESESEIFRELPGTKIAYAMKSEAPIIIKWKESGSDIVNETETRVRCERGEYFFVNDNKRLYIKSDSIEILDIKSCERI